jgi:zinc protease
VDALLDPEKKRDVECEVVRLIEELRDGGVTERELAKARKMSLSHQLQSVTTMRGRASDLGSNWLLTRNLDFSRDYLESIQRVTAADIRRVLTTYLTDRRLTSVSLNPQGTLARTEAAPVAIKAGEIQRFELSNGLRLIVREDPRLPLVAMNAVFKAGLLVENVETSGISRLFSKVVLKGTQRRTAEQIADEIEELGGAVSSESGNNSISVSARVMRPDLRAGLEILSDILQHATMPAKAVAREQEAQLASMKAEDEDTTAIARRLLRENLFGAHPYALRSSGTPASVTALTSEDLIAFRDRYLVARNGVLAVFGDVRAEEVKILVEQIFAGMRAGEPALNEPPRPAALARSVEAEQIEEKEQAILMVGFPGIDLFHPDNAALELIDEACSDLGSRLFLRIREEMGLAYFVGSSIMSGLAAGMFAFYLGTSPEKLTEVKAALAEEIEKMARDGLTPQEVARAKEKSVGQQDIRNQSNHAFAFQAALNELYGLGHSYHLVQRRQIEAITMEDIRRVARQYFQQPSVTVVVRPSERP